MDKWIQDLIIYLSAPIITAAGTFLVVWLARKKDAAQAAKTEAEGVKAAAEAITEKARQEQIFDENRLKWTKAIIERVDALEKELKDNAAACKAERQFYELEIENLKTQMAAVSKENIALKKENATLKEKQIENEVEIAKLKEQVSCLQTISDKKP